MGLLEVTLQQALECLAVTGLVPGHLMDGVMDGVQVQGLGLLSQLELAGGGAVLGLDTDGQVLLGGGGETSPSSSANLAACSASSQAAFSQYRPISG